MKIGGLQSIPYAGIPSLMYGSGKMVVNDLYRMVRAVAANITGNKIVKGVINGFLKDNPPVAGNNKLNKYI